ncbi:MAG: DUF4386 domain-containing protein [Candidatus Paceibacterota bacterium]
MSITRRQLALIAGGSYLVIFSRRFCQFLCPGFITSDTTRSCSGPFTLVRFGIMAFLATAVFDVIVAWALYELYRSHPFSLPSTYFRIVHAIIMAIAVFALLNVFTAGSKETILGQVAIFNNIWLIGLFFFGVHLLFLGRIVKQIKFIPYLICVAGAMYMIDTGAHFLLENYDAYAGIFLALVAIPSIFGEMAFAVWLLLKGGKDNLS